MGMVIFRVLLIDKSHSKVPFLYDVPEIKAAPAALGESANLYLIWDSRVVVSHVGKQGAFSREAMLLLTLLLLMKA